MIPPSGLFGVVLVMSRGRVEGMPILPGDYVEQSEHTCPSTCASLAEVAEVLEIIGCDVAVDGEFAEACQWSSILKQEWEKFTLRTSKYRYSSGKPSATRR
jgi:hypothetical protein